MTRLANGGARLTPVAGQRKGNKLMAAVGAGGGFLLGAYIGTALAFTECGDSCSDEKFLAGLSVVGLPITLGLLGSCGGSHTVGGMIYRAPLPVGDEADGRGGSGLRRRRTGSLAYHGHGSGRCDCRLSFLTVRARP